MIISTLKNVKEGTRGRGFTLIELLVVIGIIAILAAIVIVAINPSRQFAQARNAQRKSNVATILNAIGQNIADNKGIFNTTGGCTTIPTSTSTPIGNTGSNVDLDCLLDTYIPSDDLPMDPDGGTTGDTGYTIVEENGRYKVCAPKHDEDDILDAGEYCLTR